MENLSITAEVGCNHMGNFDVAKKMINIASLLADTRV